MCLGYSSGACVRKNVPASFELNARNQQVGHSMNSRTSTVIAALALALSACSETTPPPETPAAAAAEERADKAEDATATNTDRAEKAADKAEDSAAASDKSADKAEKSADDAKK